MASYFNIFLITTFAVIAAFQLNTAQARFQLQTRPRIPEPTATPETPFVDVGADEIDLEVFNATYLLTGEEVALRVAEIESAFRSADVNESQVDYDPHLQRFVITPHILRCKDGPINLYYSPPSNTQLFWPPISVRRCVGSCPNQGRCLTRKQATRYVWAIEYKKINSWGLIGWYPVSIRRICVKDDVICDCEGCSDIKNYHQCIRTRPCPNLTNGTSICYWKPYNSSLLETSNASLFTASDQYISPEAWGSCDCCEVTRCGHGQYFDLRQCKCVCHPRFCPNPQFQHPKSCRCICPLMHDCGPFQIWNSRLCKCQCKQLHCLYPRIPDNNRCDCKCPATTCVRPYELDLSTCRCRCPKDIVCPRGSYLDNATCQCRYPLVFSSPGNEERRRD